MKKMKHRIAMCVLCVVMIIMQNPIATQAVNSGSDNEKNAVIAFAQDFLEKRANYEWNLGTLDIDAFFAQYQQTNMQSIDVKQAFTDTMNLYREWRQYIEIEIEDLEVSYYNTAYSENAGVFTVSMLEAQTYSVVDGNGLPSYSEEEYTLQLKKENGQFKITDITIEDHYLLEQAKTTGLNRTATMEALNAVYLGTGTPMQKVVDAEVEIQAAAANGTTIDYIPYNRAYASAYALIYSHTNTSSGTGIGTDDHDYYNSNFLNFDFSGAGDCANFASQCLWAGFEGSDRSEDVSSGRLPMDTTGTVQWYCKSSSNRNGNWCYASQLMSYPEKVQEAGTSESGIIATVYRKTSGSNISIPNIGAGLQGAIFNVNSDNHAIVITSATSNSVSDIYYSAHSKAKKNVCLGADPSALSTISSIMIPSQFRIVSSCSGHVYSSTSDGHDSICNNCGHSRLRMSSSWGTGNVGDQKIISSVERSSRECYRIAAVIKNEQGTVIRTIPTVYNTTYISTTHTFTAAGLYKVEVSVWDNSTTTTPQVFAYSIRIES